MCDVAKGAKRISQSRRDVIANAKRQITIKKYKIDIYTLTESGNHSSNQNYFGSVVFETDNKASWVFDFLHHAGGQIVIEGIEIKTYEFEDYTLISLTDFFRDGDFYKNLIYGSKGLNITNNLFPDKQFTVDNEPEYLIIGDDAVAEQFTESDFDFLKDYKQTVVKSEYLYECGATGFWENYLIGVASSLSVLIVDKLVSFGFPVDSIKRFKLPSKIRKSLASEYNINPDSLFLESYRKEEEIIRVSFRNVVYRFHLTIKEGELVDIITEKLDKLV